jgi:hemerythrin
LPANSDICLVGGPGGAIGANARIGRRIVLCGKEESMTLIQWNDSLDVSVVEFNRQHRRLVAMINELDAAVKQGKGHDVLEKVIKGLVRYCATHFKTEEKYFEQYGYPEAKTHAAEHSDFIDKVYLFVLDFENGKAGLTEGIMAYLSDWLKEHIMVSDKRYGAYLCAHGMK